MATISPLPLVPQDSNAMGQSSNLPLQGYDDNHFQTHDSDEYISDDVTDRIIQILTLYVTPSISVLGLIGNVFSIIVLKKHGLKKCSDILLFSLAISDILFLIGANINCISLHYHGSGFAPGFRMSYLGAYALFLLQNVSEIMDWGGGSVSFSIPVMITIERLVAVFLPLKFPLIITRKRTIIAVCLIFVLWYSILIYTRVWFQFDYNNDNLYNVSLGVFGRSDIYYNQPKVSLALQSFIIYVSFTLPLPIVVTGCICIGVKVKLTSIKRAKIMVKSQESSESGKKFKVMSRTTKTLVSVCVVYSIAALFTTLPQYMPGLLVYGLFAHPSNNLARLIYQFMYVPLALNSSCNFLIYVVTNKKFRDTQRDIMINYFCVPSPCGHANSLLSVLPMVRK